MDHDQIDDISADDDIVDDHPNLFVIMFCTEGIESVINISAIEEARTMAILSDQSPPSVGTLLHSLMLRARFNPQRFYEIYSLNVSSSLTEDDVLEWFKIAPQDAADFTRANGTPLWGEKPASAKIR